MSEVCVLSDGRRVKFRVDKRGSRSTCYYAYFKGPDGKRRECSTSEGNEKRAKDAAVELIRREYEPKTFVQEISWDDAIKLMVKEMESQNLRPNTISTYQYALKTLRDAFPSVRGPGEVTSSMAKQYKASRMGAGRSPHSVKGDLRELSSVFAKWFGEKCGLIESNPFEGIEPPKTDKLDPRIVSDEERDAFQTWLSGRWDEWRLPLLFLDVKAAIGCRITELAALPTSRLVDGRVIFEAEVAKGRKTRKSKLPAALYDELKMLAGPDFVFERFPDELRALLVKRGHPHHAKCVRHPYEPARLVAWLQDRLCEFRKARPDIPWFKLHNYRGTAMSKARQAGISFDATAITFGCNAATAKLHYVKLDEVEIADDVFDRISKRVEK